MKPIQFVRSTVVLLVLSACAVTYAQQPVHQDKDKAQQQRDRQSAPQPPPQDKQRDQSREQRAPQDRNRQQQAAQQQQQRHTQDRDSQQDRNRQQQAAQQTTATTARNNARNEIETDNKNKIDSNRPHNSNNSSNSNGHSNNASKMIAVSSKFKIESNSEHSNNEHKMTISAGRDSSANGTSTCVRVQIRNSGTFGSNIGQEPGNRNTAAGSNEAAIVAIAYPTIGTGDPLAVVTTSEFTDNR